MLKLSFHQHCMVGKKFFLAKRPPRFERSPEIDNAINNMDVSALRNAYRNKVNSKQTIIRPLNFEAEEVISRSKDTKHQTDTRIQPNEDGLFNSIDNRDRTLDAILKDALDEDVEDFGTSLPDEFEMDHLYVQFPISEADIDAYEEAMVAKEEERLQMNGHIEDEDVEITTVPREIIELNLRANRAVQAKAPSAAVLFLEESLKLAAKLLPVQSPELGTILVNLSQAHLMLKNFDTAERILLRAIDIRKRVDGTGHPSVGLAYSKLSVIYLNQGKWNECEDSMKIAHKIFESAIELNSNEVSYYTNHQMELPSYLAKKRVSLEAELAEIVNIRGVMLFKKGVFEDAIIYFRKAIGIWSQLLPKDESVATPLLVAHQNLFASNRRINDTQSSINAAESLVSLIEKHHPRSNALPAACSAASKMYFKAELLNEAFTMAEKAYITSLRINGHSEASDEYRGAMESLQELTSSQTTKKM